MGNQKATTRLRGFPILTQTHVQAMRMRGRTYGAQAKFTTRYGYARLI